MKRLLFVCGVFYPEPVVSARMQTDLAKELAKKYKVTVLRPRPTRPNGFSFPDYDYASLPFEVIEIDSYTCPASSLTGRLRESVSHGRWCASYIRQHHEEIDFIYNDSWHLFGVWLVSRAAMRYGIPYVTPVQDVYPEALTSKLPPFGKKLVINLLSPLDHFSLSHAQFVHTNSDMLADYLATTRRMDRRQFVAVRNWQDESCFVKYHEEAETEDIKHEVFTFMYLGNVGPLAGIEVLFDAFSQANLPEARLVIAGSGPSKEHLRQLAGKYTCQIAFWDVPTGMVAETQSQADVMMLPMRKGTAKYSVPSKLPAYLFSAKPVIASVDADSDTAHCVRESGAGWLAEPEDVSTIAKVMRDAFMASDANRIKMGECGREYAMRVFTKEKNLSVLSQAIETILSKRINESSIFKN